MHITGLMHGEIETVKVLALRPLQFINDPLRDEDIITIGSFRYHILEQGLCDQHQAEKILKLWNTLPPGDQDRCHNPAFALQFISQNAITFTAAICWGCNNISISGPLAATDWRLFNGEFEIALQLFRLCGDVAGYVYG